MYLKSIDINGFKSFANKITFKFEKGITGIVGPNGSGKSNISDAVRWVLGEQSAKQLRGSKMEDVIFSGTETRKPQGSAYVAITLDNSDHKLPIDYNEVTVARRVYASGESEYLINGTVSRLKDVNRLFFDTGIGKEGYSIIGQGQIEKILSGKPEERRELFDEAAGIVKYKKNKLASEKALESERQNLYRVNDILRELEKQAGPLKEQSETARKYLIFKEELKKLEVNSFLLEAEKTREKLSEYEERKNETEINSERLKKEFEFTRTEYDRLEAEMEKLNSDIEKVKNEIHEKKLANERFEGEINVVSEQISSYKKSEQTVYDRIAVLDEDIKSVHTELKDLYTRKNTLDEQLDNADDVIDEAKGKAVEIENTIQEKENDIEKAKGDIIDFLNEGGTLKAKVGRYDTMLENITKRKTELNQRLLQAKSEELKNREEYDRLNQTLSETDENIKTSNASLSKCEADLRSNIDRSNALKNETARLNQLLLSLKSKKEALRNITERYDGYGNSIRRVMEKKDTNSKIIGVVADIMTVEKEYETAIETALGGSIQNIVTEDEKTAQEMIAFLKQNKAGRATFLPINQVTGKITANEEALKEDGVLGIASQLVKCEEKYKNIINNLLGRSIVVDNIDNAVRIARKYRQTLRLVTIEGELINPGGAMTGGAFKNTSNLLGRKRELDELNEEIGKVNTKFLESQKDETELKMKRDALKEQKEKLSEKLQKLTLDRNTVSISLRQTEEALQKVIETYASVRKENSELDIQVNDINKYKEELFDSNRQHENAIKERESIISDLENEIEKEKEKLAKQNEEISTLMISFNTIKQQVDFIIENIRRVKQNEKRYTDEQEELKSKLDSEGLEVLELNRKISEIRKYFDENLRIISVKEAKLSEFTEKRDEINVSHKEFFAKREELSDSINVLDKTLFKLNSSIEKLKEQDESMNNYMWEEYELTYKSAEELKVEDLNDASQLKKEISAVKSKIKLLGDVNVNAIEDYKSVSERYEFLKTQHDDIVKAEENLKNVIAELDRAMKEQFEERFKEIKIMFSKVFKELFGGGKADLILVDDSNILESGIIINAQPPGKKLQNMMQLSGGEKSLTAISLLFAIQSLKPSPFCLLDEIEAALDDSNVRRFAKYLDKLTKDTQFIVITHRKGTMEAADVLYGITMQEKGVSTLVSVNMIEGELTN